MIDSEQDSEEVGAEGQRTPRLVVEAWALAWNTHNMRSAAALVEPDVDFVTVAGLWLRGRHEFLRHHSAIHERHLRETMWTTLGTVVRELRDDLVLSHVEWRITDELDADGIRCPPRSGIFTWVLRRNAGRWLIAAAHNTNLRADTRHRLSTGGTP
jgi:uncharacterized protein (TIGR02246 family)